MYALFPTTTSCSKSLLLVHGASLELFLDACVAFAGPFVVRALIPSVAKQNENQTKKNKKQTKNTNKSKQTNNKKKQKQNTKKTKQKQKTQKQTKKQKKQQKTIRKQKT